MDIRLGSKDTYDYGQTQKQSSTNILKIFEILISDFKVKVKLLMLTRNNVHF